MELMEDIECRQYVINKSIVKEQRNLNSKTKLKPPVLTRSAMTGDNGEPIELHRSPVILPIYNNTKKNTQKQRK